MLFRITKENYNMILSALDQCESDGSMEIEIRPYVDNRSEEQHRLYRHWVNEIAHQNGELHEDVHENIKAHYLRDIYLENPVNRAQRQFVSDYVEHLERFADNPDLTRTDIDWLEKRMASRCSTKWANTKQMTELLNRVERGAVTKGYTLSHYRDAA